MYYDFKFTKTQIITIKNALEYFEFFIDTQVPEEESQCSSDEIELIDINVELNDVYEQLDASTSILELSEKDLANILTSLTAYKCMVENNIQITDKPHFDKAQKELAINNINELIYELSANLNELDPTASYITISSNEEAPEE